MGKRKDLKTEYKASVASSENYLHLIPSLQMKKSPHSVPRMMIGKIGLGIGQFTESGVPGRHVWALAKAKRSATIKNLNIFHDFLKIHCDTEMLANSSL